MSAPAFNNENTLVHQEIINWAPKLTPSSFVLLFHMYTQLYKMYPNLYYTSYKELGRSINKTQSSVINCVKELKTHGLIMVIKSKEEDGGNAKNGYKINYNILCNNPNADEEINQIHKNKGVK